MSQENAGQMEFSGASVTLTTGVIGNPATFVPKLGYYQDAGLTELIWALKDTKHKHVFPQALKLVKNVYVELRNSKMSTEERHLPNFQLMNNTLDLALHRLMEELEAMSIHEYSAIESHGIRVKVHFLLDGDNYKSLVQTQGCLWVEIKVNAAKTVHPPQYVSSERVIVLTEFVDDKESYALLIPQKEVTTHEELERLMAIKVQEEQGGDGN